MQEDVRKISSPVSEHCKSNCVFIKDISYYIMLLSVVVFNKMEERVRKKIKEIKELYISLKRSAEK